MNKILLVVLVILLAVTAVELALFFTGSLGGKQGSLFPTFSKSSTPPPVPTLAPQMSAREIVDSWNFVWMKGLTKTATIATSNEGTMTGIQYSKDRTKKLVHDSQFLFTLNSLTNSSIKQKFYYKATDVDKLTVVSLKNGKETQITLQDLKEKDKILLTVVANIYPEQGGQIQSIKITREE